MLRRLFFWGEGITILHRFHVRMLRRNLCSVSLGVSGKKKLLLFRQLLHTKPNELELELAKLLLKSGLQRSSFDCHSCSPNFMQDDWGFMAVISTNLGKKDGAKSHMFILKVTTSLTHREQLNPRSCWWADFDFFVDL